MSILPTAEISRKLTVLLLAGLLTLTAACRRENIQEIDLTPYFRGINGTAVFYTPRTGLYKIHNLPLSRKRSSPCSTFKIISSYIAFSENIISPKASTLQWNRHTYKYPQWNRNLNITEAFQSSCVWYYRRLIDRIGPDIMRRSLSELQYGNQDITDWQGNLNKDTDISELKGFWIESSLLISPIEQTQVLARLFAKRSQAVSDLKEIMQTSIGNIKVYGKTGLGTDGSLVKDAWFVGFYEKESQTVYFAVRLDDQTRNDISDYSGQASRITRQIAIDIITGVDL